MYEKALYSRQWWPIILNNLSRNLFYSPTLCSLHSFFVNRYKQTLTTKFTHSLLILALSTNVLATPTVEARNPTRVERNLASVTGVLSGISDKVGALHTSIKNYNGGNTQSVESASDTLVDAINSGTTKGQGHRYPQQQ